jgi:type III restriction enzyme
MNKELKSYSIVNEFKEIATKISLPQFFKKVDKNEIHDGILFEELASDETFLKKNSLLDGFQLASQDSQINFDESSADIYKVDYDESKRTTAVEKITRKAKSLLLDTILSKPKENQISDVSSLIVSKLGDMTPISQQDLKRYVARVFDSLNTEQIRDIVENEFIYIQKIKSKINTLTSTYSKERFQILLDARDIFVKDSFNFPESITSINPSTNIKKSLYEREDSMNRFEQDMILEIAALENVVFWHRNLGRGKGFFLNGFSSNHYPDFIVYTKKGNIIIIETKGDMLDNDDSTAKNRLGRVWAEKSGNSFSYFMVFQNKDVLDAYTAKSIIEVLRRL